MVRGRLDGDAVEVDHGREVVIAHFVSVVDPRLRGRNALQLDRVLTPLVHGLKVRLPSVLALLVQQVDLLLRAERRERILYLEWVHLQLICDLNVPLLFVIVRRILRHFVVSGARGHLWVVGVEGLVTLQRQLGEGTLVHQGRVVVTILLSLPLDDLRVLHLLGI